MRLQTRQCDIIRDVICSSLPVEAVFDVLLFGSRVDDHARGGDIDLYLEIDGVDTSMLIALRRCLRFRLEEALDMPVDIVLQQRSAPDKLVSTIAKEYGIKLFSSASRKPLQESD